MSDYKRVGEETVKFLKLANSFLSSRGTPRLFVRFTSTMECFHSSVDAVNVDGVNHLPLEILQRILRVGVGYYLEGK